MRWLNRSLLLCLVILVVTPAPAHAWFEWLDRLSGPGRWLGAKIDVRAFCFGNRKPVEQVRARIVEATRKTFALNIRNSTELQAVEDEWLAIVKQLEEMDQGLNVLGGLNIRSRVTESFNVLRGLKTERVSEADVRSLEASALQGLDNIRKVLAAIATGGIFVSLCSEEQKRSFGVEFGSSWLWTGANEQFANDESVALKTFTVGLSYRIPLPPSSDVVDLGTNIGVASFSSKGFNAFDTMTIEPFVDLHLPTALRLSESQAQRILSRFTVRAGLVFFPKGFDAGTFGPSTPRISGSEANPSITVYYNVRITRPTAPLPRPGA